MANKKKGIDISRWQGAIDANKIKASGIEFVIIREGYRQAVDPAFFDYVKKCQAAGIEVKGVYHFMYALNDAQAEQEARSCIKNLEAAGLGKDTIVFSDFEYDTVKQAKAAGVNLTRTECNSFTKIFCETVESLGYRAGIYFNIDYYKNWYDHNLLNKYVKWLSDWSGEADYPCAFHQYSSKGQVPGINGNVDMDYFFEEEVATQKEPDTNSVTAERVLDAARGWIGFSEENGKHREIIDLYNSHKPLARGYTMKYTDAWCDCFVSACAIKAGAVNLIGTEVGCENHINLFKKKGIWNEDGSVKPEVGDIILFNWDDSSQPNDGHADHIGIVEQVYGNTIVCIEGNMKNAVNRRTINVGWGYIRGYARPKYAKAVSEPAPIVQKSIEEIANEVLHGAWGNGQDRKNALTAAGYDYAAVQKRVNELCEKPVETKKTVDELANEVLHGEWGNSKDRKDALTAAGYDYAAVQKKVNELCSASVQKPDKKSIEEIAKEVIKGKWGNGQDRKNRLTNAGYDYAAVQQRVNELMR